MLPGVCNNSTRRILVITPVFLLWVICATMSLVITHLWVICATILVITPVFPFVGNLCYQEISNNSSLSFVGNLCYQEISNNSSLSFVGNLWYQEFINNLSFLCG